jgi:ABC-2 type transport system permease protein
MFNVFRCEQLTLLRDKMSLSMILLWPTLLIFILGNMLGNLDNPDERIQPFEVAYVIDSTDEAAIRTAEVIIGQFGDVEQVNFTQSASLAAVEEPLAKGDLAAAVVFAEPFVIEIHEGIAQTPNRAVRAIFEGVARLHATVTVISDPAQYAEVGAPLADSAAATATAVAPATSAAPEVAAFPVTPMPAAGVSTALPPPATSLEPAALDAMLATPRVEDKTYGVSRVMIDYYAITMIVMMFFMGSASAAAATFHNWRKHGTLRRTVASPQNKTGLFLQFLASSLPMNCVQVGITMLASTLLLGAHFAATWQLNLLLFAMLSLAGFAFSAVFLVFGMFIRFNPMLVIVPLMWVVLFLSGTFAKVVYVPGITEFMPPYLIQSAAFDLTLFGTTASSFAVIAVSLALTVVAAVAGTVLFNKKAVTS